MNAFSQAKRCEVAEGRAGKRGSVNLDAVFAQFCQQLPLIVAAVDVPDLRAFEVAAPVPAALNVEGSELPLFAMQFELQRKGRAGQPVELAIVGHGRN